MTSPRFHIGQFVAVSWPLDDLQVREIGLIVGMVWNCPQLGSGWSYAVDRPGVRPVSQSWFSDAEIIPLLANPVGPPPAPVYCDYCDHCDGELKNPLSQLSQCDVTV